MPSNLEALKPTTIRCSEGSRHRLAIAMLAMLLTACGSATAEYGDTAPATPDPASTVTTATTNAKPAKVASDTTDSPQTKSTEGAFDCPITIPPQPGLEASKPDKSVYSTPFPAPDPYPSEYPHEGMVWYGSEDLWTALPADGEYGVRKSVWWSTNYPGGTVEERPEVWATWTRLDTEEPVVIDNHGEATNAHTAEEGWFMIAGIDPDEPGCWEVGATYKGATLGYVYLRR